MGWALGNGDMFVAQSHSFMVENEFFSGCVCESECERRVGVPCKRLLVKKMEQKIRYFIRAE